MWYVLITCYFFCMIRGKRIFGNIYLKQNMAWGIVFFVNLRIRFVKDMIRRTRVTAPKTFGCRSLSSTLGISIV